MTDPVPRHHEMVEHMRRHTELRRQAAEKARQEALGVIEPEGEADGDTSGG
jgi:hypothetical protein